MKRKVKVATLLLIGEGPDDKAFINHLRTLFDSRESGQSIKVKSADGGSPRDIIKAAIRSQHAAYDRRFVFMDSDVTVTEADKKYASTHKITLILSEPLCLECMLLEVLSKSISPTCKECKRKLHPLLSGHATKKESYATLFTKDVLIASSKQQIQDLIRIISNN